MTQDFEKHDLMISVVMATHNGERTLPLTLDAFCRLTLPDEGVEFIAVDNASTDRTAEILESYKARLPLTILWEPTPGKTHALNRGIDGASGRLIVMTDDDVIPDPDWLTAFACAASAHPEIDLFAGQVRHYWEKSPPAWLERLAAEGMSYGGTPVDRGPGPIEPSQIKGANSMVRAHVLRQFRFREDLDYGAGRDMVGSEDTEFARRAADSGCKLWYLPDARIRHIVRIYQVGMWPVLQRYFRIGRGIEATGAQQFPESLPTLLGYPRYLVRILPWRIAGALRLFVSKGRYQGMRRLIDVAMICGRAYQWRRLRQCMHEGSASPPIRQASSE